MGKITIEINTGGSAFEDKEWEVNRILKSIIADGLRERKLMDINGNVVGSVEIEEDERTDCEGIVIYNGDKVYFEDWMRVKHDGSWDGKRNALVSNEGYTEEQLDDEKDGYLEEFYDWCEENDLSGEEV